MNVGWYIKDAICFLFDLRFLFYFLSKTMHPNYISQKHVRMLAITHYISAYSEFPGWNSHIIPDDNNKLWTKTISLAAPTCHTAVAVACLFLNCAKSVTKPYPEEPDCGENVSSMQNLHFMRRTEVLCIKNRFHFDLSEKNALMTTYMKDCGAWTRPSVHAWLLHVRFNLASINLHVLLKSRFPCLKKA